MLCASVSAASAEQLPASGNTFPAFPDGGVTAIETGREAVVSTQVGVGRHHRDSFVDQSRSVAGSNTPSFVLWIKA